MSIEHSSIADADRHEVKHATSALADQVLLANGDGTTKFDFLDFSQIVNVPDTHGYSRLLVGSSVASVQQPSATNTPLKIEFGSAQAFTDVSLAVDGTLTFSTNGEYLILANLNFGRDATTGIGKLFHRSILNGTQVDPSSIVTLADTNAILGRQIIKPIVVTGSATFYLEFFRDSTGANTGGLYNSSPAVSGWQSCPSAAISVYKYLG